MADRLVLSVLFKEVGKFSATCSIRESGATKIVLRDCSGFLVDEQDTTCALDKANLLEFAKWSLGRLYDIKDPEIDSIHWHKRAIELGLA